jgi:uncharacterized membrane protein (UPF0127 family)
VTIRNSTIHACLARSQAQREEGLMTIRALGKNQGMLFIFESEGYYGFWMKNMRFALDIIWINAQKKVIEISANVSPCTTSLCNTLL